MSITKALGLSITAAALAPTLLFEIIFLVMGTNALVPWRVLGFIFWVSLAHAVVLGLPAMLALLRFGQFRLSHVLGCGFAIGSASLALISWPPLNGWPFYLQSLLATGGLGGLSAAAFYFTFKRFCSPDSFTAKPLRGTA